MVRPHLTYGVHILQRYPTSGASGALLIDELTELQYADILNWIKV